MYRGFETVKSPAKIAVVTKYRAKVTVHYRGFWLPYKNYCGDQLPCNNYRALPWWLATVQSIPWLPITVHQLLCNTVVAAYRGKRYRDEKLLPRKDLNKISWFAYVLIEYFYSFIFHLFGLFGDIAFSEYFFRFLFVWTVRRTFFPSGWCFFYLVTTGWIFDISMCENLIYQSN